VSEQERPSRLDTRSDDPAQQAREVPWGEEKDNESSVEKQESSGSVALDSLHAAPLVQGSLWKAIWTMSWPLMITTVSASIIGMVDVQVAGYLGAPVQAAVGLSEQVMFLFMVFLMSLGTGTTAIVARHYGERDVNASARATAQSLVLSLFSGVTLAAMSFQLSYLLLPIFARSPEVLSSGREYISVFGWCIIPFSINCISNSAFRAIGDAKTPLLVMVAQVVINVAGDYLLVCANWPVAGLGVKGIAWATVAGSAVGALMSLCLIARSPLSQAYKQLLPVSTDLMVKVLRIGLPSAFQRLGWAASVLVMFCILRMVQEPTAALASWTIGMRVEGLLFMPLMALSLSVSSIVGQNLGAKREDRAVKAGWDVSWIGVALMVVLGGVIFIFSEQIAASMTTDAQTRILTAQYLRINSLSEPFLALAMILSGALQGAGDTRMPMIASLFTNWIIRLPLAWFLALVVGLETSGVWWAMTSSVVVYAFIMIWRYKEGSWLRIKV
jgi:putative MATE family efflux protein